MDRERKQKEGGQEGGREGGIVEEGKGGGRGRLEIEKEARVLDGEREGGNGWMEGRRGKDG